MGWKYWSARPDWAGSRSFTARHDGVIVAHAAAWPVRVRVPGHVVPAVHLIDWAADPEYPGAGIWLLRQIGARVRLMIATGGSEMTRRVLPAHRVPAAHRAVLVCPAGAAAGPGADHRGEKLETPGAIAAEHILAPVAAAVAFRADGRRRRWLQREVPEALWPQPSPATAVTARDAGFYRYLVDSPSCPARAVRPGEARRAGRVLLSRVRAARGTHRGPLAAIHESRGLVRRLPDGGGGGGSEKSVYEVSAWASTALGKEGLVRAGFRLRAALSGQRVRRCEDARRTEAARADARLRRRVSSRAMRCPI